MSILKRLLIAFLLISPCISAQNVQSVDSLEQLLGKAKGAEKIDCLNKLAPLYLSESSEKAFETAYKASDFAKFEGNDEMIASVYSTLGILHYKTSNLDSAQIYFLKALKINANNEQKALLFDNIGVVYRDLNFYDSAINYHQQALELHRVLGGQSAVANSYKNIGNVYMQTTQFAEALEYFEKSLEEHKIADDRKNQATIYNNISAAYLGLHKYAEALQFLTDAANLQGEIGDVQGQAYSFNGIGNFYFRLKVYDKAQEFYVKSLELRQKLGDNNDIAASQFNIATVHRDLGNYREALKYYNSALELRQKTHNKEAQALIYNAIGGAYKNQRNYSKAIENYQQALAMNQEIGIRRNVASCYERLGVAYKDSCVYTKAAEYFLQAIDVYMLVGDSLNVGRMYNFYGNLCKDQKQYANAMESYVKALNFYNNNTLGVAYVQFNQGKLSHEIGEPKQAEKFYSQAIQNAQICSEKSLECDVFGAMYTLLKEQNQHEKSLSYYEKYVAKKESLDNDRNKERIAELEFESDIKMLEHINESQRLKIQQEEARHTQFKTFVMFLSIVLVCVLVFAVSMYRMFVQKRRANKLLTQKQADLKHANEMLEKRNTLISNSLQYAKRIQNAILPPQEVTQSHFPEHFIFFRPKEIVSGDFYWISEQANEVLFAVADCTGHGVPGACMSMMGTTLLNQIVNQMGITQPAQILHQLDCEIMKSLHQTEGADSQDDGMTIAIFRYNKQAGEITIATAAQPTFVVQNGELQTISTSEFSIGGMHIFKQNSSVQFDEITLSVSEGMSLYLFSDGFIDQFGGGKKERFASANFEKLILEMQTQTMAEQSQTLATTFDSWRGTEQQIDDVIVIGVKL